MAASYTWPRGSLLAQLSPADCDTVIRLGAARTFDRGEFLMRLGEVGTYVTLLLAGCVKVLGGTPDGRNTLLAIRVGGDVVGELSVLDGGPRSASVAAAGPTVARVVEARAFRDFLASRPAAVEAVQRAITGKLRMQIRHRIDVGADPVVVRLARVLDHLGEVYGRNSGPSVVIDVPLSQPDLAALVAATDPSVQRAVRQLRAAGAITTGYRRVVIQDPAALRRMALGVTTDPSGGVE